MIELGQLEKRHADFKARDTQVVVVSVEGPEEAAKTQTDFPNLLVLADHERGLSEMLQLIHEKAAPDGSDTDMPTTILVDQQGIVRWLYRSPQVIARLGPDDVLRAIDQHTSASR